MSGLIVDLSNIADACLFVEEAARLRTEHENSDWIGIGHPLWRGKSLWLEVVFTPPLVGWYSRRQEDLFARLQGFKVAIYATPDGQEVEVTEAKREDGPIRFDDAVCLGELGPYLRSREATKALRLSRERS